MSLRVIQAMAGADAGGAEAFFERLVVALGRAGLEQRVLIRRNAERAARLRAAGMEVDELGFRGPLDLLTRRAFAKAIARFEPRIVMTWMNRATAACPRPEGRFVHVARLGGYYKLKYYRRATHLVGNTKGIRDYLLGAGWPPERAHYLPNFADAAPAAPIGRATVGTPVGAPLLLAMGRLHENKAFDVLLDALARLPGVHLWLAGTGRLDGALKAQAERLGIQDRVRFLGWRADGSALRAACDVFVCPSRIEPLGNVVLEAWAAGKPVVAAVAAGPVEIMTDEKSGLLVPIDDADALAAAIRRILDDPALARRLAAGGSAAYGAEFAEPAVVARYLDFFRSIA
jgi:glycosyltransferase involved in cell wall biosynthesis